MIGFFAVALFFHVSLLEAKTQKKKTTKPAPPPSTQTETVNQAHPFGVGGFIGDPIGINAKYWFSDNPMGIQGFLGYDFSESALALFTDGLYHFKDVTDMTFPWDSGKLNLYGGLGIKISFPSSKTRVVIRIPLGINGIYSGQDWDFFAELVPGIRVSPTSGGNVDAGLGLRYYF